VRGVDESEVRAFLAGLADEIEAADAERAALRAELDRIRSEASTGPKPRAEINAHAVALFSQAQQVADRLVAEAVQHARDLMLTAREQQREILEKAHEEAERAAAKVAAHPQIHVPMHAPMHDPQVVFADETDHGVAGYGADPGTAYGRQIPEIEYVRTFAKVAQVQLRSVLDALTEQVEQLGRLPKLPDTPELPPAGNHMYVEPMDDDDPFA
jgi:cell division septum initiation protein DivIVA